MELWTAAAALILAVISLGLAAIGMRRGLASAAEAAARAQAASDLVTMKTSDLSDEVSALRTELTGLLQQIAKLRDEITELRTAMETPVLTPARSIPNRNLDDLREHLRAAHATADDDDES